MPIDVYPPVVGGGGGGGAAISAAGNSVSSGTVIFSNSNNVSFGMAGSTVTASASYVTQTVQTQASGNIGATGFATTTTNGTVILGTNNTTGFTLAVPPYITTYVGQTAQPVAASGSNGSFAFSTITFGNLNGLSHYTSNGSLVASYTVPSAQTGISGLQVSNTTYSSGTITFQNANGISFGSSGANGISASYTVPSVTQYFSNTGTTFNGVNVSGSLTLNTNGLQVSLSAGAGGGGVAIAASNTTFTSGTVVLSAAGGAITISSGAQSALFSVPATSSLVATGNASLSTNGSTISIGANAAAVSIGGNSTSAGAGYSNVSTGTVILMGGNNITLSQNGASITISGPNAGGAQTGISGVVVSNTTYTSGTITFQNANGLSFGSSGANGISGSYTVPSVTQYFSNTSTTFNGANISGSITLNTAGLQLSLSAGAGAGATTDGIFLQGNTSNASSTTIANSSWNLSGLGAITLAASASSIQIQVPQTSSLVGTNGISLSTNGSTISVSNLSPWNQTISYYEPAMRGGTTTAALAAGTVYLQPFYVSNPLSCVQLRLLQQVSTQLTTTMSISGSVSAGNASSGSGSYGMSGTLLLLSRQSTGTAANSSNIVTFFSNTYSYGIGQSVSVSWSTNASSATVSYTTSGAISFISNVNSTGGITTGSYGSSSSASFSSTSAAANSFSSSAAMTFASQVLSQVRPLIAGFGTSLSYGEYWLGHIQSTNSGSTNYSLQNIVRMGFPGIVYYTSNTTAYAEIGATSTNQSSNNIQGWGSYSSSGNTSTTFPLSAVSNQSNYQLWFNVFNQTK